MPKTLVGTPDPDQPARLQREDEHAERMVLAALLTYPALAGYLTTVLASTDFTTPAHRHLFAAAVAARNRVGTCSPAAVIAELTQRRPAQPGTPDPERLVREIAGIAPMEAITSYYCAIIRDLAALRRKQSGPPIEGMPPMPMRGFLFGEDDT